MPSSTNTKEKLGLSNNFLLGKADEDSWQPVSTRQLPRNILGFVRPTTLFERTDTFNQPAGKHTQTGVNMSLVELLVDELPTTNLAESTILHTFDHDEKREEASKARRTKDTQTVVYVPGRCPKCGGGVEVKYLHCPFCGTNLDRQIKIQEQEEEKISYRTAYIYRNIDALLAGKPLVINSPEFEELLEKEKKMLRKEIGSIIKLFAISMIGGWATIELLIHEEPGYALGLFLIAVLSGLAGYFKALEYGQKASRKNFLERLRDKARRFGNNMTLWTVPRDIWKDAKVAVDLDALVKLAEI